MKNVIVDLDGTLALDIHRNHLLNKLCVMCEGGGAFIKGIEGKMKLVECSHCGGKGRTHDWKTYFSLVHTDIPNHDIIELVKTLAQHYTILIFTGRISSTLTETVDWLTRHDVPYNKLIMRPDNNRIDDHILKIQWGLEQSPPDHTLFVLEDRGRVVDAWRKAKYTCLQVAPGDF